MQSGTIQTMLERNESPEQVAVPLAAVAASEEPYVDRERLAHLMGVSVPTVDRWTRQGMPSETWGLRARRFLPSRCKVWARERGQQKAA